jgi:tRNA G37 N-methylase Trm5
MGSKLVALVPAAEAETTRRALDREGLLNTSLRAHRTSEGYVALPLASCAEPHPADADGTLLLDWSGGQLLVQQSTAPAGQGERGPAAALRRACEQVLMDMQVSDEAAKSVVRSLPKRWEKLGDIVLLATSTAFDECVGALTPAQQQSLWKALAGALSASRLGVQGRIETSLHRKSTALLLWPPSPPGGGWTEHRCNGITYGFDVTRNMFSSGNGTEKARVGQFACAGEVVVDLYAGIGYFTLAYLVHAGAAHLHACEWDEDALEALRHNLQANQVASRCTVHPGDNAASLDAFKGRAHRVNLGLIPSSEAGWPIAVAALRPEGGRMHVHANVASAPELESRWVDELLASIHKLAGEHGRSWTVQLEHLEHVKWYAPKVRHVVADVLCS